MGPGALADELLITDRSNYDVNRHQSRRRPNASRRTKARASRQDEPGNCGHERSSKCAKLCKTGAVDQDCNVVIIPRLPSVTGANKRPGWISVECSTGSSVISLISVPRHRAAKSLTPKA